MIIDLRAHHVTSARYLHKTPFSTVVNGMKKLGYIENFTDPFIDTALRLKRLFKNPNQKFRINIGGIDFICGGGCGRRKNKQCDPENPRPNPFPAFVTGTYEDKIRDIEISKKYDLIPEKIYTVAELKEKLNF